MAGNEKHIEYKSREFCHAIKCPVQIEIDAGKATKEKCKTCKAWEFHNWLKGSGYYIIKIG